MRTQQRLERYWVINRELFCIFLFFFAFKLIMKLGENLKKYFFLAAVEKEFFFMSYERSESFKE